MYSTDSKEVAVHAPTSSVLEKTLELGENHHLRNCLRQIPQLFRTKAEVLQNAAQGSRLGSCSSISRPPIENTNVMLSEAKDLCTFRTVAQVLRFAQDDKT